MQKKTNYKNIIKDIIKFFESILDTCKKNNIPLNSIVLDPGIGFWKNN